MNFQFDWLSIFKSLLPSLISIFPILLIIGLFFGLIYCWKNHVRIKFKSFTKKGFRPVRGDFGVFCYTGAQGKGKTYSLIEFLFNNQKDLIIFSNIHNLSNIENVRYFTGFKQLIEIKEALDSGLLVIPKKKKLVIVFDEIFTELQKGDKLSKPVLDFLCQMRKRKIKFLTTAQYWGELPLSYRRFCRFQIDCNMIPFLWTGILIKVFHDAENMKWDQMEQDFVAPITETTITKCSKKIANSYDTFLRISSKPTEDRRGDNSTIPQ